MIGATFLLYGATGVCVFSGLRRHCFVEDSTPSPFLKNGLDSSKSDGTRFTMEMRALLVGTR